MSQKDYEKASKFRFRNFNEVKVIIYQAYNKHISNDKDQKKEDANGAPKDQEEIKQDLQ